MKRQYPGAAISEHQLPPVRIAFEPIFNVNEQKVVAFEAKADGQGGESFEQILSRIDPLLLPSLFIKASCAAIRAASALGIGNLQASLFLPCHPQLEPEQVNREFLMRTAVEAGLRASDVLLAFTGKQVDAEGTLDRLLARDLAGESAGEPCQVSLGVDPVTFLDIGILHTLESDAPKVLKLRRRMIADIDQQAATRTRLSNLLQMCEAMNLLVVGEGVGDKSECNVLRQLGVHTMQGPVFGDPMADSLCANYPFRSAA